MDIYRVIFKLTRHNYLYPQNYFKHIEQCETTKILHVARIVLNQKCNTTSFAKQGDLNNLFPGNEEHYLNSNKF